MFRRWFHAHFIELLDFRISENIVGELDNRIERAVVSCETVVFNSREIGCKLSSGDCDFRFSESVDILCVIADKCDNCRIRRENLE